LFFYGILSPEDNGTTTFHISKADGTSYERSYPSKLKAGDYIIIQGPFSKESSKWDKHTVVHSITLDKKELNLVIGDSYSIRADIYNKDADNDALTWSSTNNEIAEVDQEGNITALSNGDAQIVVNAADGSASATCDIHIRNLVDFISLGFDLRSSQIGGTTILDFNIPITNRYFRPLMFKNKLGFGSNSTDVITSLSEITSSFSFTSLSPTESSSIYVHLLFSKSFVFSWGTYTNNQNWITVEFTRNGDNTLYRVKKYLPFNLS
jgi:Bacterial surface proteins containing Ig-like domains